MNYISGELKPYNAFASDLAQLIPAVYISVPRDDPYTILNTISDERLRLIHEGGFAYARGDFAKTIDCYKQNKDDDAAKLCSSSVTIAAAIGAGDYPFYSEVETFLKNVIAADINAGVTALAELSLSTAYLGAMAPGMVPEWLKNGDFSALPPQAKTDAAYKRAKYFQCTGDYNSMLVAAQTALNFCDSPREISFPGSYLRMMCAIACFELERHNEAEFWLSDAMKLNLPHGFVTCFAELIPLLGGMTERILEREYPLYYRVVIDHQKRLFANWVIFHNYITNDMITHILSLRDYEIAQLAARGVPYREIAKKFYVSEGRMRNIIKEIQSKLNINNKTELAKFVL